MRAWPDRSLLLNLSVPAVLALLTGILGSGACSRESSGPPLRDFPRPLLYEVGAVRQFSAMTDSGYRLMEQGRYEKAAALFRATLDVVPKSKGRYNLACALARGGRNAAAIEQLTQVAVEGFDDADLMAQDADLAGLRADPAFPGLLLQVRSNRTEPMRVYAEGLPDVEKEMPGFDLPDLDSRIALEQERILANRPVWFGWQYEMAQIEHATRRLAVLHARNRAEPDSLHRLNRIRFLAGIRTIEDTWGPLSDGVQAEAARYLEAYPRSSGADEAAYWAGAAAFARESPQPGGPAWKKAVREAKGHFRKVRAGSALEGGAAAWNLMFELREGRGTGESRSAALRAFAAKHRDDPTARQVTHAFFRPDLLRAVWPIPLEAADTKGAPVSLEQYRGKVLLLDFWATWCGPCRDELPRIRQVYRAYHERGFEILSVSLDSGERTSPETYGRWVEENDMPWRHVYDGRSWESPLVRACFVYSIPCPMLIGRDGSIEAMGEDCRGDKLAVSVERALSGTGA